MTGLIVAAGIAAYLFIAGALGYGFYVWRRRVCGCLQQRVCVDMRIHEMPASLVGVFWPAAVPMMAGVLTVHHLHDSAGDVPGLFEPASDGEEARVLSPNGSG